MSTKQGSFVLAPPGWVAVHSGVMDRETNLFYDVNVYAVVGFETATLEDHFGNTSVVTRPWFGNYEPDDWDSVDSLYSFVFSPNLYNQCQAMSIQYEEGITIQDLYVLKSGKELS